MLMPGSNPSRSFCVEFACCPDAGVGFPRHSRPPPTETGWVSLRRSVQGEPVTLNGTEEKKAVMAKPAAAQKHKSCHQSSGLNICCLWASRSTQSFQ